MQIVINLPKDIYENIMTHDRENREGAKSAYYFEELIQNGTPLPEGHGRLIDEKEINTVVNGVFNVSEEYSSKTFLNVLHSQCIEAVGAHYLKN